MGFHKTTFFINHKPDCLCWVCVNTPKLENVNNGEYVKTNKQEYSCLYCKDGAEQYLHLKQCLHCGRVFTSICDTCAHKNSCTTPQNQNLNLNTCSEYFERVYPLVPFLQP